MTPEQPGPEPRGAMRRTHRAGWLASPALLLLVALTGLGALAFVTCEVPPTQPPPPDAGWLDAATAPDASVAPDACEVDANDPRAGDPCVSSQDCSPPAMICCAGACLPPRLCM